MCLEHQALVQKPELHLVMWQRSLKTATDRAVSCTDLKLKRILSKECSWQCRNEKTSYQAAREHQRGDTAINLPSLIQSCSGRTWAFPGANQLLGHSWWKHRKEGRHMASVWFLAELFVSNLFLSALPCAREILGTRMGRLFSVAPSLQTSPSLSIPLHLVPRDTIHLHGGFTNPLWRGQLKNRLLSQIGDKILSFLSCIHVQSVRHELRLEMNT